MHVIYGSIGGLDACQLLGILGWTVRFVRFVAIVLLWRSEEHCTALTGVGRSPEAE